MPDTNEFVPIDRGMGLMDPVARDVWRRAQAQAYDFEKMLEKMRPYEEILRELALDQFGYAQDPSLALQWLSRQYILLRLLYLAAVQDNHVLRATQSALHETPLEVHQDHLAALRNLVALSEEDTDGTH
jgi:hypothetical protein